MARARWIRADACAQNDDAQEGDRTVSQIRDDSEERRSRSHESRAGRRRSGNGETRPSDAQVPMLRGAHAHHCESNCPEGFSEGKIDEVFSLVALRRALFLLLEVFLGGWRGTAVSLGRTPCRAFFLVQKLYIRCDRGVRIQPGRRVPCEQCPSHDTETEVFSFWRGRSLHLQRASKTRKARTIRRQCVRCLCPKCQRSRKSPLTCAVRNSSFPHHFQQKATKVTCSLPLTFQRAFLRGEVRTTVIFSAGHGRNNPQIRRWLLSFARNTFARFLRHLCHAGEILHRQALIDRPRKGPRVTSSESQTPIFDLRNPHIKFVQSPVQSVVGNASIHGI